MALDRARPSFTAANLANQLKADNSLSPWRGGGREGIDIIRTSSVEMTRLPNPYLYAVQMWPQTKIFKSYWLFTEAFKPWGWGMLYGTVERRFEWALVRRRRSWKSEGSFAASSNSALRYALNSARWQSLKFKCSNLGLRPSFKASQATKGDTLITWLGADWSIDLQSNMC